MNDKGKAKKTANKKEGKSRDNFRKSERRYHALFEQLRESEEKYRSLVESTEDSIYLLDKNYKFLFMNQKQLSRLGLSKNQYLGHAYSEFHSPEATKELVEKAEKVFRSGESVQYEHRSLRDGRYFLRTLSPVKGSDGETKAINVISKDITERRRMEEQLRALSLTDELTGLYNRRGFLTLAEQQLRIASRLKKGMFMLYADLDNLKEVNDAYGHGEGDLLIIETGQILKDCFRESDIIARIGGDEFVVFPAGTNEGTVETIASRLQEKIEIHNARKERDYKLSLSVGMTYYDPESPCSIDELLVRGDKLMYEQKKIKQKFFLKLLTSLSPRKR